MLGQHTKFAVVLLLVIVVTASIFMLDVFGGSRLNLTLTTNKSLDDGLIGHWTFDGKHMNDNVEDRLGSYDGTLNGQTSTTTTTGALGQGLEFDGVDDYVSVTPDGSFVGVDDDFSIAFWAKSIEEASGYVGVTALDNSGDVVVVYFRDGNNGMVARRFTTGSDPATELRSAVDVMDWHHYVLTSDGGVPNLNIFVDGNNNSANSFAGLSAPNVSNTLLMGRAYSTFYGNIALDDYRVYDRILSDDEIKRLYELGATTHINKTLTTNSLLEKGLVNHWTFDGKNIDWGALSGGIKDRISAENGDPTSMTETNVIPGRHGQALDFDGSDDYITVTSYDPPHTGTVSLWYRKGDEDITTARQRLFGFGDDYEIQFGTDDIINNQLFAAGADALEGPVVQDKKWHHFIATYDFTGDGTMEIYHDGKFFDSSTNADDDPGTGNLLFGWRTGAGATQKFEGQIDDIRIYNRVLTASEVNRLYGLGATTHINKTITTNPNLENGLVFHHTYDGKDMDWAAGNEILDRSGNGNDANAESGITKDNVTTGKLGQALDISSDTISMPSTNLPTGDFTYAMWFYPGAIAGTGGLFTSTLNSAGFEVGLNVDFGSRNLDVQLDASGTSFSTTINRVNLGKWNHVVLRREGSDIDVILNNVNDTNVTATDGDTLSFNCELIMGIVEVGFGGSCAISTTNGYTGKYDDFRIYNRALSDDEVTRLYQLGSRN